MVSDNLVKILNKIWLAQDKYSLLLKNTHRVLLKNTEYYYTLY